MGNPEEPSSDDPAAERAATARSRRVQVQVAFDIYELPPSRDAVIIGREAAIGFRALADALEHMVPGVYQTVETPAHPLVEAVLIRRNRLQVVPADRLVPHLLAQAEGFITADMAVDVSMNFTLESTFDVDVE